MGDAEIAQRKAYLQITPEDEERLRSIHPIVLQYAPEIVEQFYEFLLSHAFTREMLQEPGLIERLKKLQMEYFLRLTSGDYDRAYVENRLKVGFAHERVGLAPEWYMGAYARYLQIVADVLRRHFGSAQEATVASLGKIIHLDMSLAIDAYVWQGKQRLLKLDQIKRQLTEMIVHDLQNPLAGIQAFLEMLSDSGRLTPDEHEALDEALSRCGDLGNMILNVLQVGKLEEGKLELYLEEMDLRDLVPRCVAAFDAVARRDQKKLSLLMPESPVNVRTDQTLLQRVLYNLIGNALKHSRAGTRVDVEIGRDRTIVIADNGPGIPRDLHDVIFERFGSTRAREAGLRIDTGLGLPFCRMATDALGIRMDLESEPGEGTRFTLSFP